jgi:hypothetical protein
MKWMTRERIKVRCAVHFSPHPARDHKTLMQTQRPTNPTETDFLDLNGY